MSRPTSSPWPVRLATLALWALAAASVVAWGLRSLPAAPASPAPVAAPDVQAIARLLGAAPAGAPAPGAPAAVASRYTLVGVLADRDGRHGAALIAVAGQPAKPFRVGAKVDGDLVLQALAPREAHLGPAGAPATLTLSLPAHP
ncbi:MAG: general secretion pathway protein C [Acidovorax sp. SCN 68-22]|nr:MAG: general secretion pathway protein C [Acidovorax sp. SCN 68-22]